jgi:hypothetical protein
MNKFLITIVLLLSVTAARAQNIAGIGAQLLMDTTGGYTVPRIAGLVAGSPADNVLKATDYIIMINGVSSKNVPLDEVVGMIRGEAGTHVSIIVADTKEGKRPRTYMLTRVGMQMAGGAQQAPPDPTAVFYEWCDARVKELTAKGASILKTYNSACGNYFFNFDATPGEYHVCIYSMEVKGSDGYNQGHTTAARVFDNEHEADATKINKTELQTVGNMLVSTTEGEAIFKKSGVGVVNTQVVDDHYKCHNMYVVVYRLP